MTARIDTESLSAEALGIWHFSLLAASLDQALPLFEDLGLRLADKATFQRVLRRCFEAAWETSVPAPEAALVTSFLSALEANLGAGVVRSFIAWFDVVMLPDEAVRARASLWDQLLTAPAKGSLPALAMAFRAERARYAAAASVQDQPRSAWDLQVYATHRFDQDDGLRPMAWIAIALRRASFLRAWNRTVRTGGAAGPELQSLFDWVHEQARTARIPEGELGDPRNDFVPLPRL